MQDEKPQNDSGKSDSKSDNSGGITETGAWECAAKLLAADTKVRRLVGARPHETTIQAVGRYVSERDDDSGGWMDNPWEWS